MTSCDQIAAIGPLDGRPEHFPFFDRRHGYVAARRFGKGLDRLLIGREFAVANFPFGSDMPDRSVLGR
jgi:hypothetical protein